MRVNHHLCGHRCISNGKNGLSIHINISRILYSPALYSGNFVAVSSVYLISLRTNRLYNCHPTADRIHIRVTVVLTANVGTYVRTRPPYYGTFLFTNLIPPGNMGPRTSVFLNRVPLTPCGAPNAPRITTSITRTTGRSGIIFVRGRNIITNTTSVRTTR